MRVVIDGGSRVGDFSWMGRVSPAALRMLGVPESSKGDLSVVLLPGSVPEANSTRLEFEPASAKVLNLGRTDLVVFVFGGHAESASDHGEVDLHRHGPRVQNDDDAFQAELVTLPEELQQVGQDFLKAVRHPDDYFQRTSAGRFVNRPNNYWTVKVQPRDQSLRITVRGRPEDFRPVPDIELKPDQNGYSAFKLERPQQARSAIALLRQAAQRSQRL